MKKEWTQGYACAVAVMLKINGINDAISDEVFKAGVGSIKEAEEAEVDESDLDELKRYYK